MPKERLPGCRKSVYSFVQWINLHPAGQIDAFLILIGERANFIHWLGIYLLDKVIHPL